MGAPKGNTHAQKDDRPRDDSLLIRLNKDDKRRWKEAADLDPFKSRNDFIIEVMNDFFNAMLENQQNKDDEKDK